MTAGNNGTPEPGNDDPFAYLYRQEGADPGQTAATQPGVPRTSYNQVQRVGERRQAPPQQQPPAYGYPPQQQPQQPQQGYGQQPPQYGTQQLPPQQSRSGGYGGSHGGHSGHSGSGGPNSKGLLIGAVAVVAAVSIGIGVAMANGTGEEPGTGANPSASATAGSGSDGSSEPSASASASASSTGLGSTDAASLLLSGGAQKSTEHTGAKGAGGEYVDQMTTPGATVTWTVDSPKAGPYELWVRYANAEKDAASATTVVNGTALGWKIDLKNYGKEGDWASWYTSYVTVNLKKGSNTVAVACGDGDACHFNLDQIALVKKGDKPDWA